MEHPKTYLLRRMIEGEKYDLKTLGRLHAEHVDDLVQVITSFAEEAIQETMTRLQNGERVIVGDIAYESKASKRKPKLSTSQTCSEPKEH